MIWKRVSIAAIVGGTALLSAVGRAEIGPRQLLPMVAGALACFWGGWAVLRLARTRKRGTQIFSALAFIACATVFCVIAAVLDGETWRKVIGMVCLSAMPAGTVLGLWILRVPTKGDVSKPDHLSGKPPPA
jgi:peptidoglycan/LPS O-acetylase OafA/YrhL